MGRTCTSNLSIRTRAVGQNDIWLCAPVRQEPTSPRYSGPLSMLCPLAAPSTQCRIECRGCSFVPRSCSRRPPSHCRLSLSSNVGPNQKRRLKSSLAGEVFGTQELQNSEDNRPTNTFLTTNVCISQLLANNTHSLQELANPRPETRVNASVSVETRVNAVIVQQKFRSQAKFSFRGLDVDGGIRRGWIGPSLDSTLPDPCVGQTACQDTVYIRIECRCTGKIVCCGLSAQTRAMRTRAMMSTLIVVTLFA